MCLCVCLPADNPTQIGSVSVAVKVLDVNDNPPSLNHYSEAVCENAKAGGVKRHQTSDMTALKQHNMKKHQCLEEKWDHDLKD